MGFFDGPSIVNNGLVLSLDAADKNSYPGSGTIWTDLGGSAVSGSLVASPTFNSSNGGSIVLNGTTQYANLGNNTLGVELQNKSVSAWIFQTATPAVVGGIIDKDYDNTSPYGGWGFWITSANKMNFWVHPNKDLTDTGTSITNNIWQHIAISYNYSGKSASFYLNGNFNSTITNATIVEQISDTTTMKIGVIRTAVNYFFTGRIANLLVYNRALSANEISQNYNAQKSRFGL